MYKCDRFFFYFHFIFHCALSNLFSFLRSLIRFPNRALKDQGYESDSTLVFRKKDSSQIAPLSPVEQKQAYLNLQAGGEAPMQGFRKPAPEKPRGESFVEIQIYWKEKKKVLSFPLL